MTQLKVHDNSGVALQVGVEYRRSESWELLVDYKRLWLKLDANGLVGVVPTTARVTLDPDLVSAGVQLRFRAAGTLAINEQRRFRALPRDRSRRRVEQALQFSWQIIEAGGSLSSTVDQEVEYAAPSTPGLTRLKVLVTQREVACTAEALITVTASLDASMSTAIINTRGLPGYTYECSGGQRRTAEDLLAHGADINWDSNVGQQEEDTSGCRRRLRKHNRSPITW